MEGRRLPPGAVGGSRQTTAWIGRSLHLLGLPFLLPVRNRQEEMKVAQVMFWGLRSMSSE